MILKKTIIVLLCLSLSISLFSETKTDDNSTINYSPFELSADKEAIITSTSLAINLASFMFTDNINKDITNLDLNMDQINSFDKLIMNPYNETLDSIGDIFQYVSFFTPLALLATPYTEWLTIGVMYTESFLFTYGTKNLVKDIINRPRPFMYYDSIPTSYIEDFDCLSSFPSGHTALAFTGAAFSSFVFSKYFNDSIWKLPVIIGSYTLATTTAVLRIASGNHFLSDVIAGAVIGTISGFGIPLLHLINQSNQNIVLSITPMSFVVTYKFTN